MGRQDFFELSHQMPVDGHLNARNDHTKGIILTFLSYSTFVTVLHHFRNMRIFLMEALHVTLPEAAASLPQPHFL